MKIFIITAILTFICSQSFAGEMESECYLESGALTTDTKTIVPGTETNFILGNFKMIVSTNVTCGADGAHCGKIASLNFKLTGENFKLVTRTSDSVVILKAFEFSSNA